MTKDGKLITPTVSNNRMIEIEKLVLQVREDLSKEYDVVNPESEYYQYRGLSDEALRRLFNYIDFSKYKKHLVGHYVHGEQKHSPAIKSENWDHEHTWGEIYIPVIDSSVYVDQTSSQFQWLYTDIPDYYISMNPPKWYYPDKKNPRWNLRILSSPKADKLYVKFIYGTWGRLSDFIYKMKNKKK